MATQTIFKTNVPAGRRATLADGVVLLSIAVLMYAALSLARQFLAAPAEATQISLAPAALPTYTLYSLGRMFAAYVLSVLFTLFYGRLAGLLEHLSEKPGDRVDIYQLVEELKVNSEHLLLLTEAAELLGFASVGHGDIALTALGQTFADASIQARKEIFSTRIRRLPVFHWLLNILVKADKHELEWDVIQSALELDFPAEEAEKQVEIAVNWGCYAELISYDDDRAMIYLEETKEG